MGHEETEAVATEHTRNPFVNSAKGGRVLSAMQLPIFMLRPPAGYGILITTGRKTGKTRRRCVRAVRVGEKVFIVAIKGPRTQWLKNALAGPDVRVRLRGGTFAGTARKPDSGEEMDAGRRAYSTVASRFEYLEYTMWRKGRPTAERIAELHRLWFDRGTPIVIDLRT